MNHLIAISTLVLLGSSAGPAEADPYFPDGSSVELQYGSQLSAAVVELISPTEGSTSRTAAFTVFARLRHRRSPIALEYSLIMPQGWLGAALIDFWRADHWRVHADVGVFKPFGNRQLSVTDVKRSGDLVLGFGAEAAVIARWPRVNFTADWRIFLPDPFSVVQQYGDFVRPIFKQAQRGAQLCLGASWLF